MNEQVVVDFSKVDAALKLAERERRLGVDRERTGIAKERAEATVKILGYSAAACALIIVSIGFAIWLGRQRPMTTIVQHVPTPQAAVPTPQPPVLPSPTVPAGTPPKIVTSYTQFRSITAGYMNFNNAYFSDLTAGHHYPDSNAVHWDHAWCYAMFWKDGLQIRVSLATRNGPSFKPDVITSSERQQLGLTDSDISSLRVSCPWKQQ